MIRRPKPKDKKPSANQHSSDRQNFRTIGIIFFATGLGLTINESSRATGIPFLILGLTFIVITYSDGGKD